MLVSDSFRSRSWAALVLACVFLSTGMPLLVGPTAAFAQDEEAATDEPGASKKGAADEETAEPKSFLIWLHEASGICGYAIGVESVLLVSFLVTNGMTFRRENFIPQAFVEAFEQKLQQKDYQGAYELAKKDDSFLAKILVGGLSRLPKGYEEAVAGMQEVGEDENMTLDHKLSYISLIGSTAPMLGLLGTVQGMIVAFSVIANSSTSPKPSELAGGITMALVTTFEGLIVAIPAIVGLGLLKNRQARLVLEVGIIAEGLMSRLVSSAKRPAAAPAPAPAS